MIDYLPPTPLVSALLAGFDTSFLFTIFGHAGPYHRVWCLTFASALAAQILSTRALRRARSTLHQHRWGDMLKLSVTLLGVAVLNLALNMAVLVGTCIYAMVWYLVLTWDDPQGWFLTPMEA